MHPVRVRRSFAVRAWLALALAAALTSSVVASAEAPGRAVTLPAVQNAAAISTSRDARAGVGAAAVSASTMAFNPALTAERVGVRAAPVAAKAPAVKPVAKAAAASKPAPHVGPVVYAGRNHFWFPALGINQAVYAYPCDSSAPPGSSVYRWGCAGANNVYLLAHAGGKFAPVHDAYVDHRLKAGMLAIYADGAGHVHYYRLQWVKVTAPLASSHWAWDPQAVSSLTLQTCLGAQSQWRIFVRFVEVAKP